VPAGTGAPRTFIVWLIAAGVTLNWASIYYSFPALLPQWESDLGWSRAFLISAFTGALLISAISAPLVGMIVDRGRGRALMVGSALLGALCLAGLTFVQEPWQFLACWLLLGVAQAGALYEPCFAVLTRSFGTDAKRPITRVTLVAGFAGTISFPTAHALAGLFGWRGALIFFAAMMVVSAGILFVALGRLGAEPHAAVEQTHQKSGVIGHLRGPLFWLLALSVIMLSLNHATIITHLLPLLSERGVGGDTAILAAAMIGPMQITGRLAMMAAGERSSALGVSIASFIAMAVASAALFGTSMLFELVVVFVILQGAGFGVTSITRPVIIAACYGRRSYGAIAGALALPLTAASALAPTLAALIWSAGGYDLVVAFTFCSAVIGCLAMLAVARLNRTRSPQHPLRGPTRR
jgi:MFS family permease